MSGNAKSSSRDLGDSSLLINWVLNPGSTCHMTPQVLDFIPGSLEDTDKYIEVVDWHNIMAKQKVHVQIQMCDDNGDTFIVSLHNVLLASDICDRLFSKYYINEFGTFLFTWKKIYTVCFGYKKKTAVNLPHSTQQKHAFLENKANFKIRENMSYEKNCFGILTPYIRTHIYQIIDKWS